MRSFWIIGLVVFFMLSPVSAAEIVSSAPKKPDANATYLFYLHGSDIDKGKSGSEKLYHKTVKAIAELGFVVISEVRQKGLIKKFPKDHENYAQKVTDEVNGLVSAGVPAGNIIVAGFSRGGVIANISSALIGNPEIRFAIMAGCVSDSGKFGRAIPMFIDRYAKDLKGRFLSLRDDGDDDFGSCAIFFDEASGNLEYKEVVLSTGKGHVTFREPLDDWLKPLADWSGIKAGAE